MTLTLADGRTVSQEVRAGSSYLSSEDERVHFGLGAATSVARLTVRYPWGARERPARRSRRPDRRGRGFRRSGLRSRRCARGRTASRPARRRPAAARSRRSGTRRRSTRSAPARASEPVQARDLFDVSSAMWNAWAAAPRTRLRPRRRDQLRRLPRAALAGVLRLEPEPDVRPADERAARALLLAGLHHQPRRLAGGAGKPDRRSRDRRRPARRLERVAALRRPDLHVARTSP